MQREIDRQMGANLVVLVPLIVGGRKDALDLGLSASGEGGVREDQVEAGEDLLRPLGLQLLPHDLPARSEAVKAQETRLPPIARRLLLLDAPHRRLLRCLGSPRRQRGSPSPPYRRLIKSSSVKMDVSIGESLGVGNLVGGVLFQR